MNDALILYEAFTTPKSYFNCHKSLKYPNHHVDPILKFLIWTEQLGLFKPAEISSEEQSGYCFTVLFLDYNMRKIPQASR